MPSERTRVGHVVHDDVDVYAGRHGPDGERDFISLVQGEIDPGDAGWLGNPYPAEVFGREESVAMFVHALFVALERDPTLRAALVERCRGQVLGCWCQRLDEDAPVCHAEVIARVVDDVLVRRDQPASEEQGVAASV